MIDQTPFSTPEIEIVGSAECLWKYRTGEQSVPIAPPAFEIDGQLVVMAAMLTPQGEPIVRGNGVSEHHWRGQVYGFGNLELELTARIAPENSIVRFRYVLHSTDSHTFTKSTGSDNIRYLSLSLSDLQDVTEIRLSEFNEMVHSFCLSERQVTSSYFENAQNLIGPIVTGSGTEHTVLAAYEHGAQVPDSFLNYQLDPQRNLELRASKGNYWHGRSLGPNSSFETVWMHIGAVAGDQATVATAYREFVLRFQSDNLESRKPYIFYNTWNYQERVKAWQKKPYLDQMNEARMLAEIDAAHAIGIDVFVIDTGWYEKTGDWKVDQTRFPNGMEPIRAKLHGYGMKLGLWFNPTVAAMSSDMYARHSDCAMTRHGAPPTAHEVWETEASFSLCLVSRYADSFADELIRLVREVGVTYFKWDAIGQYGCDDPGHNHGNAANSEQERSDCYAFEQARAMARIVDKLCAACPEAIVDFDITEGGRTVGLSFLSAGKYFLINNGPYSSNYDMPVPTDGNVNLFFFPGPARAWICRTPLTFDKWVPSVLFLTHYLPDDHFKKYGWTGSTDITTDSNQWISLASLVLGQNGIWGDLLGVTPEGVARLGTALAQYKLVRDDITEAALLRTGDVAGSPEVYEKINPRNSRGVVSVFASAGGTYTYITHARPTNDIWHNDGVAVTWDSAGHACITASFTEPGAKVVFFK